MKRLILIAGLSMMGAATAACAQQHAQATSDATNHAASTESHLSPVYTDGKCRFRLKVVPGQRYVERGYTFYGDENDPVSWGFGFGCNAGASQDAVDQQLDIKQVNGQTVWTGTGQPFEPAQHFKVTKFAGKNWAGTATGYDDTTGEESTRGRTFLFCLVENHGPQVLCGTVQTLPSLTIDAKYANDRIQQVLTVLKTIEFVDAPAQPPAPSSASSQH